MSHNASVGQRLLDKAKNWPKSWAGSSANFPLAEGLLLTLTPFLESLVASGLSPTSLHRHFGNIWLMGGEITRKAEFDPTLRDVSPLDILLTSIDEEGGPICQHIYSDQELRSYESTCRKLYKYLISDE